MSSLGFRDFKKALFLFLTLHSVSKLVLSVDEIFSCNRGDWTRDQVKSFHVVIGQNFSLSLSSPEIPLLSTQSFVWMKGELGWKKPPNGTLEFSGSRRNVSFDVTRYKLIEDTNGTLRIFISSINGNDMGRHVIEIFEDMRTLCTVSIFDLIVEYTEPHCSSIFDKKRRKFQMSCQWVQMIDGEHAQLVAAGNRVLYEHVIENVNNFEGQFNLTNKFHIYVDPHDIWNKRRFPNKCVISHPNMFTTKVCKFLPVRRYKIKADETEKATYFECCSENNMFPLTWWYIAGGELISLDHSNNISTSGADQFPLLCGEEKNETSQLQLYGIGNLNLGKFGFHTTGVSDSNSFTNSADGRRCQSISVNITRNISEDSYPIQDTTCSMVMTSSTTQESRNTAISLTLTLAIFSALAFSLTSCIWLMNIRGFHRCRIKPQRQRTWFEMNPSEALGDDSAESVRITSMSSSQFRPRRNTSLTDITVARGQHSTDSASMHSCQESQIRLLSFSLQSDPKVIHNRPIGNNALNNPVKRSTLKTGCPSTGTKDSMQGGGARPHLFVPSAPFQESAYCSLDDVDGIHYNNDMVNDPAKSMPLLPSPKLSDEQTDHFEPYNVGTNKGRPIPLAEPQGGRHDLSMATTPGPAINVDELYAKPDMSAKSKKIAVLESDYDDPRVPDDDFYQKALGLKDGVNLSVNDNQLYSNTIASPTDDGLTCAGEMYVDASGHTAF